MLPDDLQFYIYMFVWREEHKEKSSNYLAEIRMETWGQCPFFIELVTKTDMSQRDLNEYWVFMDWMNTFQPFLLSPDEEESEEERVIHSRLDSEWNRYLHIWENIWEHYYD